MEEQPVVGGACRTEYPFSKAPGLGHSSGAYLLGVMPPELIAKLGLKLQTIRRDPHYFLPTYDHRYLLLGSDKARLQRQVERFFSKEDWQAAQRMEAELAQLRDDLAPAWLQALPDDLPPMRHALHCRRRARFAARSRAVAAAPWQDRTSIMSASFVLAEAHASHCRARAATD